MAGAFDNHYADLEWLEANRPALSLSQKFLRWSESLIEGYVDKWGWRQLCDNESAIKLFNSWTKQEISIVLKRIRSAHGADIFTPYDEDDIDSP